MFWGYSTTSAILPECKTPTTKEQYEEIAAETLQKFIELEEGFEEEGWSLLSGYEDLGVEIFEKPDSSGFACVKAASIVNCSPKKNDSNYYT